MDVGLGGLFSGIANYASARDTNKANLAIARETNAMNIAEAEKNRSFQASMSNTEVTRRMHDLRRAGLNPLLAATGGASAPSGAQATAQGVTMENALGAGLSTAMEGLALEKDLEKKDEEIKGIKSDTLNTDADTLNKIEGGGKIRAEGYIWDKIKSALKFSADKAQDSYNKGSRELEIFRKKLENRNKAFDKQKSINLGGPK